MAIQTDSVYANASKLKLGKPEQKKLQAPFDKKLIEIFANGAIYIPHIFISKRLTEVLGIGQWSLSFTDMTPTDAARHLLRGQHILKIKGCFVGEDYGEMKITTDFNSYKMAMATLSATAVRRICALRLNCGTEVYEAEFQDKWRDEFATTVVEDGQELWCKKGGSVKHEEGDLSENAAKKKPATPEDLNDMLLKLGTEGKENVIAFAVERGFIQPDKDLYSWPLNRVARGELEIQKLKQEIIDFVASKKAKAVQDNWRLVAVPFQPNKGKILSAFSKEELAELWDFATGDNGKPLRSKYPDFVKAVEMAAAENNFQRLKSKRA